MALQIRSAVPISTALVCLQDRLPSAVIRRVQPLQLQEQEPSMYCRVWYSMFGFESEAKLQTRLICLFMWKEAAGLISSMDRQPVSIIGFLSCRLVWEHARWHEKVGTLDYLPGSG